MKDYRGTHSNNFKQTRGKQYLLNPAIYRHLPVKEAAKLLELGCGDGFYSTISIEKGYAYTGIDIAPEMIEKAKSLHPQGTFHVGSALSASNVVREKYDAIILSMLFPEFDSIDQIYKTLQECHKLLNDNGLLLIGVAHPCFDKYMTSYLFNEKNVETDFEGYFESSTKFIIRHNEGLIFEDHHWTLADYINSLSKTGFALTKIDECKPTKQALEVDSYYEKRLKHPTYLLLCAKRV